MCEIPLVRASILSLVTSDGKQRQRSSSLHPSCYCTPVPTLYSNDENDDDADDEAFSAHGMQYP